MRKIIVLNILLLILSINRIQSITWPLTNLNWVITSCYGPDRGHSGNWHEAIDISTAGTNQPALAVLRGKLCWLDASTTTLTLTCLRWISQITAIFLWLF